MKRMLVALLAVGLLAAACSGDTDEDEGPVKMGFLNGQSGDYGPWGHWALAAAEVAVEELNAGGGVLGRTVELVVEDNGSTPEGAVSGFAELTEVDGIHALGGIESDGMIAIFDTVHELKIPTICSTCGTTELDNTGGDMVFRIIPSDTDNGIVGAQVARDEGYRNVAMLVELSEGTESPANVFKAVFTEQMGGSITEDVRFNAGEATYAAQVSRAFESNPDAVYIAAGFEPLLNEWQRRGYTDVPMILTTDLLSPEIAQIVGGVEGAKAIVGATAYDTENNPAWDAYVPKFEAKIDALERYQDGDVSKVQLDTLQTQLIVTLGRLQAASIEREAAALEQSQEAAMLAEAARRRGVDLQAAEFRCRAAFGVQSRFLETMPPQVPPAGRCLQVQDVSAAVIAAASASCMIDGRCN